MKTTHKITTNLWFDGNAEQAAEHYISLIPDSRITQVARWGKGGPGPEGSVMTVAFELAGQSFLALNGGPQFKLTPAISLVVSCDTQREVDQLWARILEAGGKAGPCGWIEDQFGLSWQIVPARIVDLIGDPDPVKSGRVAQALMTMQKIDIAALESAHAGR